MSTPKNHHFIPEVYLKEFSNSQKQLFCLRKGFSKVTIKTVAQVCYKPNYFKLNSKDNLALFKLDDLNHIEKNVFKKHENGYPRLLKKITGQSLSVVSLNKSEVILFLEILATMKTRNPSYRENIINHYKSYVTSDQFQKDMEVGIAISKRIDKIDPEEYVTNYIHEALTNEDKQADLYLRRFLDKDNKTINNVAQTLLQYKLYIYHAPFGSEFITSDNPGFTLWDDNQLLSFGGFGQPFKFVFPLTPKCCLFITSKDVDPNSLLLSKEAQVVYTDINVVNAINDCTFRVSLEKVFSYSSNTLTQFKNPT